MSAVGSAVDTLNATIDELEDVLKLLIEDKSSLHQLLEEMSDIDRAKLLSTLGYSITSLSWASLRTAGSNVATHPIKKEIERVRSYMARVQKTEESLKTPQEQDDSVHNSVQPGKKRPIMD